MPDLDRWDPLSLDEVVRRFSSFPGAWWIAGGWAIELAVGRRVRDDHADIDVTVARRDAGGLHELLAGWELWAADPPGTLRPWPSDETLPPHVHDIWCRSGPDAPWGLQLMIDDVDGDEWVCRRPPHLRRPLDDVVATSDTGVPYLIPSVQLHYKAARHRPKDEVDLRAALSVLAPVERRWLRDAIGSTLSPEHPWLDVLDP